MNPYLQFKEKFETSQINVRDLIEWTCWLYSEYETILFNIHMDFIPSFVYILDTEIHLCVISLRIRSVHAILNNEVLHNKNYMQCTWEIWHQSTQNIDSVNYLLQHQFVDNDIMYLSSTRELFIYFNYNIYIYIYFI